MKLELKHLAPYLPYDLNLTNCSMPMNGRICELLSKYEYKTTRPILRSMSELSGDHFMNLREITSRIEIGNDYLWFSGAVNINQVSMVQEYLFEHHFDLFLLIPAGLAVDINSIKP